MKKGVFDLPANVYLRALTRIERYCQIKNMIGEHSEFWRSGFKPSLDMRNEAIAFLIKKGLMSEDGALTESFSLQNSNPLISDAAYYAREIFS